MTENQIDRIRTKLDYLNSHYKFNIDKEQFIYGISKGVQCSDSVDSVINFCNLYKLKLKESLKSLYDYCFSLSSINAPLTSLKATAYSAFVAYDIVLTDIFYSDIFLNKNDVVYDEVVLGGMSLESFYSFITPKYYANAYAEFESMNLKTNVVLDQIDSCLVNLNTVENKELIYKRLAIGYLYLVKNTTLFNRYTSIKSDILNAVSISTNKNKAETEKYLMDLANDIGNQKRYFSEFIEVLKSNADVKKVNILSDIQAVKAGREKLLKIINNNEKILITDKFSDNSVDIIFVDPNAYLKKYEKKEVENANRKNIAISFEDTEIDLTEIGKEDDLK